MAPEYRRMVVSAVRADGNVNLTWAGALVDAGGDGIPAMDSYTNRAPGDVVLVLVDDAGMLVMGKAGAGKGTGPISWKDVRDKPDLTAQGIPNVPDPKDIPPDAAVVWQNSYGGWHRTQAINSGRPVQGAYGGPLNHGGWFYGTKIVDACQGHTASGMWVDLTRSSAYHGNPRDVRVILWLIADGSPSSGLPTFTKQAYGPALERGGSTPGQGFALDASWVADLASGAAKGIGVRGYASLDSYIQFGDCGEIHIEFSA